MTPRAFLVLAVLTLVTLLGAAATLLTQPEPARIEVEGRLALPDLAPALDRVARIEIVTADGEVTLIRDADAGAWRVEQRAGYPADAQKVRGLLVRLADLRLAERKTAREALLPRLELGPPGDPDSASRRVVLRDAAGEVLADLVVGKRRNLPTAGAEEGIYLRQADSSQAWLAAGGLEVEGDPVEWTAREVINVPGDSVARVEIRPPEGDPVVAEVADPETVKRLDVLNLPEGRKADEMEAARLGAVFALVDLQDVRPADEVALPEARYRVTLRTFEGLEVSAEAARVPERENTPWAIFEARVAQPAPQEAERLADLQARVAEINDRVGGWAYQLSPGVFERLARSLEDVLAEPEPES